MASRTDLLPDLAIPRTGDARAAQNATGRLRAGTVRSGMQAVVLALLQVPLAAKLVGAQALVVAMCGVLVAVLGLRPEGREGILLLAVAGLSGLPITIALVNLALRPLRQLEATAQ